MTEAAKFCKKPVVVEAMQLVDGDSFDAIMKWLRTHLSGVSGGHNAVRGWWVEIATLEGVMTAEQGDWVICGVKGEFYPCKPDIFEMTYEQAQGTDRRGEHLRPSVSDRGFISMPELAGTYPGFVRTYESSGAAQPQVWLKVRQPENLNHPEGPWTDATVHLSVEAATQLAEQVLFLVEHHYQTCDDDKREEMLTSRHDD